MTLHLKIALYLILIWMFVALFVNNAGPYILRHDLIMDSISIRSVQEAKYKAVGACMKKKSTTTRECMEVFK